MRLTDCILENGCDVFETLAPTGVGGDIATDADGEFVVSKLRPKLSLIGGMDQFNILTSGTKEQITEETRRLFRVFGKDGGYICSASDHFFDAPPENLKAFADAAKQCVY